MIRLTELAMVLAPLLAILLWRAAIARGLSGPPPRQLMALLAVIVVVEAGLIWMAESERLPPGRYVPAAVVDGQIVRGHSAGPGE